MVTIDDLQATDEQREKYYKLLNDNKLLDKETNEVLDELREKLKSKEKIDENVWAILAIFAIFYKGNK